MQDDVKWEQVKVGIGIPNQQDRQHQLVAPVLRLVLCFTSLVDTTESADMVHTHVSLSWIVV